MLQVLSATADIRSAIAMRQGYPSYSHMKLRSSCLGGPAAAGEFLPGLLPPLAQAAAADLEDLGKLAQMIARAQGGRGSARGGGAYGHHYGKGVIRAGVIKYNDNIDVAPWDVARLLGVAKEHMAEGFVWGRDYAPYFMVPGVLEGISRLLSQTMGLSLTWVDNSSRGSSSGSNTTTTTSSEGRGISKEINNSNNSNRSSRGSSTTLGERSNSAESNNSSRVSSSSTHSSSNLLAAAGVSNGSEWQAWGPGVMHLQLWDMDDTTTTSSSSGSSSSSSSHSSSRDVDGLGSNEQQGDVRGLLLGDVFVDVTATGPMGYAFTHLLQPPHIREVGAHRDSSNSGSGSSSSSFEGGCDKLNNVETGELDASRTVRGETVLEFVPGVAVIKMPLVQLADLEAKQTGANSSNSSSSLGVGGVLSSSSSSRDMVVAVDHVTAAGPEEATAAAARRAEERKEAAVAAGGVAAAEEEDAAAARRRAEEGKEAAVAAGRVTAAAGGAGCGSVVPALPLPSPAALKALIHEVGHVLHQLCPGRYLATAAAAATSASIPAAAAADVDSGGGEEEEEEDSKAGATAATAAAAAGGNKKEQQQWEVPAGAAAAGVAAAASSGGGCYGSASAASLLWGSVPEGLDMREWAPHLMEHFVTQPAALQVEGRG